MPQGAGKRRFQAVIEQYDGTITNGQPAYSTDANWDPLYRAIPCSYVDTVGGEVVRGIHIEAEATGLVGMLSTPRTRKITPKMRIRIEGRKLNILSKRDLMGRKRELFFTVREQQ